MKKTSELNFGEIEKKIGYTFKDKSLLTQAFTRTSFCNEINPTVKVKYHSNEVLEFFGDGVLSLSIITFLLKECTERYEHGIRTELGEGDFSNIKSKLSDKQNLSKSMKALGLEKHLLMGEGDYKLGIIRYAENYDKYFKDMLDEKGLVYEMVAEFSYSLLMSRNNPLADKVEITFDDLVPYIEIAHADPYVPSLPLSKVVKEELPDNIDRRIFIFERASQFDILSENPETFMWVSPTSDKLLQRYGLVEKKCRDNKRVYKDVFIYRKGYNLTKLDKNFITAVCNSKRAHFK